MSGKENVLPVPGRRSKLPVPKLPFSSAKKGKKRAVSPSAGASDCKRSPSNSKRPSVKSNEGPAYKNGGQRMTLGELPCEQRKIVKVRRQMIAEPSNDKKSLIRKPLGKSDKKVLGMNPSQLPDQSGIVFEKDDSALQSILDESGIQFSQPQAGNQAIQSKFTRHTLAASTVARPQRESTAPSRIKTCVDNFRKVCDDFISRASSKQSNPKRQCTGAYLRKGDDLNLKLTPSKTDFCSKFGVEKSVTFQGVTPISVARQSLPGRTKVHPLNPLLVPHRSSMVAQTPRRLEKVGEEVETAQSRLARNSLSVQTPQRILKKTKDVENPAGDVSIVAGRQSICPQTSGHVSLSAQTPGRPSLAPGSENRLSFFSQSSHPHTVGRFSLYERPGNSVSVGRPSISTKPPGRVSFSAQKPTKDYNTDTLPGQGRFSLAPQTPGRVSLSAQRQNLNPSQGRLSMFDQTPGRVKISKHDPDQGNMNFENICQNLKGKFQVQTPGRVFKKEKVEEKENQNEAKKDGSTEDKDKLQTDIEQKDCPGKTPTKVRTMSTCATPVRVKQLQVDEQTPKFSPQRVLKPVLTPQHTPRRVPVVDAQTPRMNSGTPQGPVRFPFKVMTPGTPSRVLLTGSVPSVPEASPSLDIATRKTQPKKSPILKVPYKGTPNQDMASKKPYKEETPNRKTPSKNRLGDSADLRTFWKTKKTPLKSPVLKEVLTEESTTETSTPTQSEAVVTTIKRKKTLTWADALESCQSLDSSVSTSKSEDEKWDPQDAKTLHSHDAMQDNPHQEKTTSSPTKDANVAVTDTQNSLDNMQLPVCLTGSSSAYPEGTPGSIDVENKSTDEAPCMKLDDTLVSHPPTFAQSDIDSLSVSQQQLGQHHSNVLANTTQNEFLQKQIELFEEKKRQLSQLQMQIQQQLFKASDPSSVSSENKLDNAAHSNGCATEQIKNGNSLAGPEGQNLMETVELDNINLSKNLNFSNLDFQYTSNTSTQGTNVRGQVNLDLNSNVTGPGNHKETTAKISKEKQPSPTLQGAETTSGTLVAHIFSTPVQQKTKSWVEEDITPYILRSKSELTGNVRDAENNKRTLESEVEGYVNVRSPFEKQAAKEGQVSVPLWTPLALKTVAKQQSVGKINEERRSVQANSDSSHIETLKSESKPKIDNVAKSDIDTKVTIKDVNDGKSFGLVPNEKIDFVQESSFVSGQYPKTPPNKKSAFCSVKGTGLSPVVGSLSLRANTATNHERLRKQQSSSLHTNVLKVANERYVEALLDDEVALFMCRLSPGRSIGKGRELCCDPVARILLHGDDMHFIPLEMEYNQTGDASMEGSAFTKYSVRAT